MDPSDQLFGLFSVDFTLFYFQNLANKGKTMVTGHVICFIRIVSEYGRQCDFRKWTIFVTFKKANIYNLSCRIMSHDMYTFSTNTSHSLGESRKTAINELKSKPCFIFTSVTKPIWKWHYDRIRDFDNNSDFAAYFLW